MKKNVSLLLALIVTLTMSSLLNAQTSLMARATGVLQEVSLLADEFNLTVAQKAEMRSIMIDYLPSIAFKANSMMNNRESLLKASLTADELDEELLQEIADKQGQMLAGIIVSKEHMKKDIRAVLTEEQKGFVDELLKTLIQFRLDQKPS